MSDRETHNIIRGAVTVGVVKAIKDDGETQVGTIEWADGIERADAEIMQPFGMGSVPDENGAIALALAVGGDQGHVVILPIGNPSGRVGGLAPGEAVVYSRGGGSMMHLKNDGSIAVDAAAGITMTAGGAVKIEAPTISLVGNVHLGTEDAARPASGIGDKDSAGHALAEGAPNVFLP